VNSTPPPADGDGDGIPDSEDNCPNAANPLQEDADGDDLGDACDTNSYAPALGTAAADANGNEGSLLSTSGSFTDQDGNNSLTITKVSGAGTVTDNGNGTWSWSHTSNDDASGTVVVQASDGEHASAQDSFLWSAVNVQPSISSASFGGSAISCGANNASLSVAFSDPGSLDTHKAEVDWNNDGTYDETVDPYTSGSSISHTYGTAGSHTAKVRITDDDGGVSDPATASVTVNYNLSGILQPVNDTRNGQQPSMFKYGSTVPVKVEITDCDGSHPSNLDVRVYYAKTSSNPPPVGADEGIATNAPDAGNQMRFSDPIYIFNFGTKNITDSSSTVRIDVKIMATNQITWAFIGLKAK
jgi:hypothetical protein